MDAFAKGVSAREAVTSLLGVSGPRNTGTVGATLVERSGKRELDDELDPERARRRANAESRSSGQRSAVDIGIDIPVMTLRSEMDAVLRGEISSSEQVKERVAQFDEVLSKQPTPEATIVMLTPEIARIPTGRERGSRVLEPSFTASYLVSTRDRPEGVRVAVRLVVPAGIPAYFQAPASAGKPGVLLLGSGLEWEVQQVINFPEQTFIFAQVVDLRPGQILGWTGRPVLGGA